MLPLSFAPVFCKLQQFVNGILWSYLGVELLGGVAVFFLGVGLAPAGLVPNDVDAFWISICVMVIGEAGRLFNPVGILAICFTNSTVLSSHCPKIVYPLFCSTLRVPRRHPP